jgi:hypothetical protein
MPFLYFSLDIVALTNVFHFLPSEGGSLNSMGGEMILRGCAWLLFSIRSLQLLDILLSFFRVPYCFQQAINSAIFPPASTQNFLKPLLFLMQRRRSVRDSLFWLARSSCFARSNGCSCNVGTEVIPDNSSDIDCC